DLHKRVGKRAVVAAIEEGVGTGFVGLATGPQDMMLTGNILAGGSHGGGAFGALGRPRPMQREAAHFGWFVVELVLRRSDEARLRRVQAELRAAQTGAAVTGVE